MIEVMEAEALGLPESMLCLYPFVSPEPNTPDENGKIIPGRIAFDSPYQPIRLTAKELAEYDE